MYKEFQSADVARAAIRMALSENRSDENELREKLAKSGIRAVAVNFGGKFLDIILKFMSLPLLQPSVSMLSLIHMLAMGPLSEPWNPLSSRSSLWRWG